MNKAMVVLTLIMTCISFSSAQNKERHVAAELRRVNGQEVAGLLRNDVTLLRRIWSDKLVVTNPLNNFVNKQDVLRLIESGILAFSSYERTLDYIHVYGNIAVVAGSETVVWAGKMPNAGRESHLRFTGIWMRQKGHWQQVARHANIVVRQ
jgi:hypothetical protein